MFNLQFTIYNQVKKQTAQSLVELLVAIGLAAILLPALFWGLIASTNSKAQESQTLQASSLLKEAGEAVRSAREANWTNIATNGTYHPVVTSGAWGLVSGAETINQYTRTITIASAFRDSSGNLVTSGGSADPSTKLITVSVSWTTPSTGSVASTFFLTRYLNNQAILQPSPNPFDIYSSTTSSGVVVTSSTVKLNTAGAGLGDWCATTPKVVARLASGEIVSAMWATVLGSTPPTNRVYFGTGGSQYDLDLYNVNVTDPQVPNPTPVATLSNSFTNNYETNDVFGEPNNAYIATNSTTKHIVIFNVTPSAITEIGSVNLGTTSKATGVFVIGNTGYAVAGRFLYTFDLTSRSGTKSPLSGFELSGTAKKLYVVNTGTGIFAFVAINATSNQLQVVDVTNRTSMVAAGTLTVAGQAGQDVFASADGLRAYLVTAQSATQAEFFIINTSSIFGHGTMPAPIGSYNLGTNVMNPRAVKMVLSKNRALIVGTGGNEQYVVLDIRNEASPVRCSGMAVAGGSAFAVSPILEADGDAYAYIATNNQANQFQIIEGGPGSQYATSGLYESVTFDAGSVVSFNRLQATFDQPPGTNMTFQVAVAPPSAQNNCTGVTFAYQNLTNITTTIAGTTTTLTGVIPYITSGSYQNPGRCVRYKATLVPSGDFKSTPTLQNIRINYTP